MKKRMKFYIPVIFWCAFIFVLSSIPGLKIINSSWDLLLRKGAHVFMYSILLLLTYRALINAGPRSFRKENLREEVWVLSGALEQFNIYIKARASLIISFTFCTLYAVSDEIHQAFVPKRSGNLTDFFYDLIGIFLAIIIINIYETGKINFPKRIKNYLKF